MIRVRPATLLAPLAAGALAFALAACDKKPQAVSTSPKPDQPAGHTHAPGDGHDHGHGPATALGEQTAGGFTVKAVREGDVKPGGEATFDIAVSGGAGKPAAVRLWVGTQDATGSVKAKAEAEGDGWHAHVEVPNPLPAGAKLWVEVESAAGEKSAAGFDLKM
ncbi:MAG: hypothetical protein JNK35_04770 [Phycisphaerae bacterium]|nr:hypothetical protein [Phycisphaerae bacterium]